MNKIITSSLLILLILFALSSCLDYEKEYLPLGEVKLYVTEELSTESRRLHFNFFTSETYDCLNYSIRHNSLSSDELIEIDLVDIEKSSLCLSDTGPAYTSIDLGNYTTGNYPIRIWVGTAVNDGHLEVSDERYVVNIENPQMLIAQYDTLNRIPEDIIWGAIGYYIAEADTVVNAFLDSLESVGAQPRVLTPGEYGYFQADSTGQIIAPESLEFNSIKTFVYDYTEPIEKVEEVIEYFANYYANTLFVYLYNSDGEIFITSDY